MLQEIIILILLTFLPLFELRLSIPVGILATQLNLPFNITLTAFNLNPFLVATICILANILLGYLLYELLYLFNPLLKKFPKIYKLLQRSQRRLNPYIEKYGILGIALFVAIPLPGSGSYTASIGSFLLGIKKKDFYIANTIGVILAGILVTLITTGILSLT